jgi:hypothetical protein
MYGDRITLRRIGAGLAASLMLVVGTVASAQERRRIEPIDPAPPPPEHREIGPIEFRERLIAWAAVSERSFGSGTQLAEKIAALTEEQVEIWLSHIDDPAAFLDSTSRVTRRLQELGRRTAAPATAGGVQPLSPTTLTTPFPPDYPPGTGAYKDVIIDTIASYGISGASSTNRCDAADWGGYVAVWWPLNKGIDELDGACVVAGCDPTGVACAIACGVLETAKIALKVAAVPLEACDVHQGAIDGAEIEATHENVLGIVDDVAHVHGDLATHDADLKAQLAAHDADVKVLLASLQGAVLENQRLIKILTSRQLEIMRLLITPNGVREINSDVLTCTGDDCPTFPTTQICSNGSLQWNCKP